MPKTIPVSPEQTEAAKPDWLKQADFQPLHDLYESSLTWRIEMHAAQDNPDAQGRIRAWVAQWDIARHTITLAEAERRWNKSNLRQNPPTFPYRWQSQDRRGVWLTTTYAMEAAYGPEPEPNLLRNSQ